MSGVGSATTIVSYLNVVDAERCDVLDLRARNTRWLIAEHDIETRLEVCYWRRHIGCDQEAFFVFFGYGNGGDASGSLLPSRHLFSFLAMPLASDDITRDFEPLYLQPSAGDLEGMPST